MILSDKIDVSLYYFDYVYTIIRMTENKSLLLCTKLPARLEDLMSLRGLPSAIFGIYTYVVLRLFFILCVLHVVKNKFTLPYLFVCLFRISKPLLTLYRPTRKSK